MAPRLHILRQKEIERVNIIIRKELSAQEIGIDVLTDLNSDTIAEFRTALYAELEQPYECLVLDLQKVRSINSAALGAILMFQKKAKEKGKRLRIARCSDELWTTFRTIRLDTVLEMPPTPPPMSPAR
jgi:anti-anti-sigma factor